MKQSKAFFIIHVMAFFFMLAIFSQILPGEDFTVNVPIDLKNLPARVIKGEVSASAYIKSSNDLTTIGDSKSVVFDIVGGSYSNTIVLKFNAAPGRDPNLATHISVGLWLSSDGQNYWHPSVGLSTSGPYAERDTTQPFREGSTVPIVKP
jgi:hypothetical protein